MNLYKFVFCVSIELGPVHSPVIIITGHIYTIP